MSIQKNALILILGSFILPSIIVAALSDLKTNYFDVNWTSAKSGTVAYSDYTNSKLSSVPKELQGLKFFPTMTGDYKNTGQNLYQFKASGPVTVYIAANEGKGASWMGSKTSLKVTIGSTWLPKAKKDYTIYKKEYKAGTIVLGKHADKHTRGVYLVFVDPKGANLGKPSYDCRKPYQWTDAKNGAKVFVDEGGSFSKLPSELVGGKIIQTARGDRRLRMKTFVTFKTTEKVTVYAGYSTKSHEYHHSFGGKDGWKKTSLKGNFGGQSCGFYSKSFNPGTVNIPAICAYGKAEGNGMAIVVKGGGSVGIAPIPAKKAPMILNGIEFGKNSYNVLGENKPSFYIKQ